MEDIIAQLKALPLTVQFEQDTGGIYGEIAEFRDEYEEEATQGAVIKALAHGLKGWGNILSQRLETVKPAEVPYILKALVSTEDEIEECLRKSM